jgi:DnaB-like helicase N terminal domain
MTTKVPQDADAEQIILAHCLVDQSPAPLGDLAENEFFSESNRKIVRAIAALAEASAPVNLVEVVRWMQEHGNGVLPSYVSGLSDGVPLLKDLTPYRTRIRDAAAARGTINEAWELGEAAKRGDITEIAERAKKLTSRTDPPRGAKATRAGEAYPEAPPECWHGIAKLYLRAHEQSTEASDNYHLASFLVVMGSLLGRYVFVKMGRTIYPNLFAVLVGKSGRARKDTAIDYAANFLQEVDPEVFIPETIDSREGFIEELAQTQKKLEQSRLFGALRFVVRLNELRQLLDKAAQKGAKNIMPTLCAVYDCRGRLEVKTRTNPACVTDPTGGFVCGTDPEWLQELTIADIKAGIGNRVWWIPGNPKPRKAEPPDPDTEILNPLKGQVRSIVDYWRVKGSTKLRLTSEAQIRWNRYYEVELDRRDDDELMAVIGERDHTSCRKVAMIYAALDKSEYIETFHLNAAIAFTNFLYEARFPIFKGHGLGTLAQLDERIVEVAKSSPGAEIPWRSLRHRFKRTDIEVFERRMGWLTREDGPLSVKRTGRVRVVKAEE